MRVLIIHQAFAALNEPGGTRHHEIARYLVDHGHDVTVIASPVSYLSGASSNKKVEVIEGVQILRAYTYVALHRSFVHRTLSFLSFMVSSFFLGLSIGHIDLIWGTSPPIFQGVTAWSLARLKGAKFLFEVRDLWPEFAVAVGVLKNPTLIAFSEWLERFLYNHSDRLIVNSPGYLKHVADRGGENVTLIPNGADAAMFSENIDPEAFITEHELNGKFVVLYAGAHGMSNDLEVLLDAAKEVANIPDIHFIFVGDGKEKQNLTYYALVNNIQNVSFVDSVPKDQMASVIAASDVCVGILKPIESYKKTYPNKVFDYMAGGKPIALAIDGVIREVVEIGECGIFCQPGNPLAIAEALRTYYNNPELARKHGENAKTYLINHFDRETIAADLLKLISSF